MTVATEPRPAVSPPRPSARVALLFPLFFLSGFAAASTRSSGSARCSPWSASMWERSRSS